MKIKDLHYRCTDHQHGLPLVPVQRQDGEQALQEGDVEDGEVEGHGEGDRVDEHGIVAQEESQERLAGGQGVHRVQHLNHYENGERDGGGGLGHIIAEHLTSNLGELRGALVEVGLKRWLVGLMNKVKYRNLPVARKRCGDQRSCRRTTRRNRRR